MSGRLFIVATPIGNLEDLSFRALQTLKSVDTIVCEDSRRTRILLNHYQIKKPLIPLHKFNEAATTPRLIQKLSGGQNLALVSDAGMPLLADPGHRLVQSCIQANIGVEVIPGPSAVTAALAISGLPTNIVLFLGYPPKKGGKRLKLMEEIKKTMGLLKPTVVLYEAPHRLLKTLEAINQTFGNIPIVVVRELTKIHEEIRREDITSALEHFRQTKPKGEFTLIFQPF